MVLIFLMPLAGKLVSRIQARYMIIFGLLLCAAGMFHTMTVTPQTDFNTFVLMRITQVLGLPFLFIPVSTLAFSNVPREKSNKASALFSLFRNVGGSIGIALAQTYVSRMMQVHQHHLSEHLIPGNPAYQQLLSTIQSYTGSMKLAMGSIYHTLQLQSTILAYSNAFEVMGLFMVGAAGIGVLLLPSNRPSAKGAAAAAAH
jgi:DHA2 family multidrug resistance protein